jgi:hypothetical protein
MSVPLQTNKYLIPLINKYGCALLCSLWIVSHTTGRDYSIENVNALYDSLIKQNIINEKCYIKSWKRLFEAIPSNLRFLKKESATYETLDGEEELLKWQMPNQNHFTVGNGKGIILFDPMDNYNVIKLRCPIVEKVILKCA